MANAKRASMREGPLAALFRKTDEASEEESAGSPAAASDHVRATPPHPALSASTDTREQEESARGGAHPARAPAPRVLLGDPRERDGSALGARP